MPDYDIVSDFTQDYNRAYMLLNTYYAEAYRDVGFYLGNQWSLDQMRYLNSERRNSFTFNKVRKIINMVSGYQKAHAESSIVLPFEDASEATAEQLTELLRHVMEPEGYGVISKAFLQRLTTERITLMGEFLFILITGMMLFGTRLVCVRTSRTARS